MMLAVAFVALAVAFEQSRRRWVEYRGWSRMYAEMELEMLASADEPTGICGMSEIDHRQLECLRAEQRMDTMKLAEYCRKMKEKYSLAMYYPWLSVEPDPPVPQ